jgi:hypothetical protein
VNYAILENVTPYTGRELRSGWVAEGAFIEAALMAHILVEHPDCSLPECVLRQRLLICLLAEALKARGVECDRDGDDIYVRGRKLTVSIAAPSAASSLIHLGINVDTAGAPVPAIGLGDLSIDPRALLEALLAAYQRELTTSAYAATKVRSVP